MSPNSVVVVVESVVFLEVPLEPWHIVENVKRTSQVGESCDDPEDREQSSTCIHVEAAATVGDSWDVTKSEKLLSKALKR